MIQFIRAHLRPFAGPPVLDGAELSVNRFCPQCGTHLTEPRDLREFWITLLKCPSCGAGYLEVASNRFAFIFQALATGCLDRLMEADRSLIATAVARIRQVDYRTVSLVDFERTLLGIYDPGR